MPLRANIFTHFVLQLLHWNPCVPQRVPSSSKLAVVVTFNALKHVQYGRASNKSLLEGVAVGWGGGGGGGSNKITWGGGGFNYCFLFAINVLSLLQQHPWNQMLNIWKSEILTFWLSHSDAMQNVQFSNTGLYFPILQLSNWRCLIRLLLAWNRNIFYCHDCICRTKYMYHITILQVPYNKVL